ncbi:hypothetical protein BD769DRAFT_1676963 [Suillus cothurnatus]|nr:hypothetical protein BD769DRAFT_1676963 [Suillus cothurnatus]
MNEFRYTPFLKNDSEEVERENRPTTMIAHVIPDEEWDQFIEASRRPLPTTFCIAGSREYAHFRSPIPTQMTEADVVPPPRRSIRLARQIRSKTTLALRVREYQGVLEDQIDEKQYRIEAWCAVRIPALILASDLRSRGIERISMCERFLRRFSGLKRRADRARFAFYRPDRGLANPVVATEGYIRS